MLNVEVIERTRFSERTGLVTFSATYWRGIHAEMMTHRLPSRNAGSSRAVPTAAMIENASYVPIHWQKNQKGMSGFGELDLKTRTECVERWLEDAQRAKESAQFYADRGLVKGVANRCLEPYSWIQALYTFRTETLPHFLNLRDHPAAEPHMRDLAVLIGEKVWSATEREGGLHLPYVTMDERLEHSTEECCLVSAVRCRRVSYFRLDTGSHPEWSSDLEQGREMVKQRPMHASPFEHQAYKAPHRNSAWAGNLAEPGERAVDFVQFRKTLDGEYYRAQ